jgi:hypothetical protein
LKEEHVMAESKARTKRAIDKHREQRSAPAELDPDLETVIDDEMRSSGRTSVVPRTAVIGAHPRAVTPDRIDLDDEVQMPRAGGSDDVAPTARALERENIRHMRQSALGVAPAGKAGRARQKRNPTTAAGADVRAALDAAAAEADREVATGRFDPVQAPDGVEGDDWIERHPRGAMAGAAAAALLFGVGVALVRARS